MPQQHHLSQQHRGESSRAAPRDRRRLEAELELAWAGRLEEERKCEKMGSMVKSLTKRTALLEDGLLEALSERVTLEQVEARFEREASELRSELAESRASHAKRLGECRRKLEEERANHASLSRAFTTASAKDDAELVKASRKAARAISEAELSRRERTKLSKKLAESEAERRCLREELDAVRRTAYVLQTRRGVSPSSSRRKRSKKPAESSETEVETPRIERENRLLTAELESSRKLAATLQAELAKAKKKRVVSFGTSSDFKAIEEERDRAIKIAERAEADLAAANRELKERMSQLERQLSMAAGSEPTNSAEKDRVDLLERRLRETEDSKRLVQAQLRDLQGRSARVDADSADRLNQALAENSLLKQQQRVRDAEGAKERADLLEAHAIKERDLTEKLAQALSAPPKLARRTSLRDDNVEEIKAAAKLKELELTEKLNQALAESALLRQQQVLRDTESARVYADELEKHALREQELKERLAEATANNNKATTTSVSFEDRREQVEEVKAAAKRKEAELMEQLNKALEEASLLRQQKVVREKESAKFFSDQLEQQAVKEQELTQRLEVAEAALQRARETSPVDDRGKEGEEELRRELEEASSLAASEKSRAQNLERESARLKDELSALRRARETSSVDDLSRKGEEELRRELEEASSLAASEKLRAQNLERESARLEDELSSLKKKAQVEVEGWEERISKSKETEAELRTRIRSLEQEVGEREKGSSSAEQDELVRKLEEERDALLVRAQCAELNEKNATTSASKAIEERDRAAAARDAAVSSGKYKEIKQQLATAIEERDKTARRLEQANKQLEVVEEQRRVQVQRLTEERDSASVVAQSDYDTTIKERDAAVLRAERALTRVKASAEESAAEVENCRREIERLKEEGDARSAEHEEELEAARKEIERLLRRDGDEDRRAEELEEELAEAQREIDGLRDEIEELRRNEEKNRGQKSSSSEEEVSSLQRRCRELEDENDGLKARAESAEEELEEIQTMSSSRGGGSAVSLEKFKSLLKERDQATAQIREAEDERDMAEDRAKDAEARASRLEEDLEEMRGDKTSRDAGLRAERDAALEKARQAEMKLTQRSSRLVELREKLDGRRKEADEDAMMLRSTGAGAGGGGESSQHRVHELETDLCDAKMQIAQLSAELDETRHALVKNQPKKAVGEPKKSSFWGSSSSRK